MTRPIHWTKAVVRPHPPLFVGLLFLGHTEELLKNATGLENCRFDHLKKERDTLYLDDAQMAQCVREIERRVAKEGTAFYRAYARRCRKHAGEVLEAIRANTLTAARSELTSREAAELIGDLGRRLLAFSPYLLVTIAVDKTLSRRVDAAFGQLATSIDETEVSALRSAMLRPAHRAASERARTDEQEIVALIRSRPDVALRIRRVKPSEGVALLEAEMPNAARRIHAHAAAFGWLPINYFRGEPQSAHDVMNHVKWRLDDSRSHLGHLNRTSRPAVDKTSIRLRLSADDAEWVMVAREFMFLRTFRLELFFRAHHLYEPIWAQTAALLKVARQDLVFLTHEELEESLRRGQAPLNVIRDRKSGFNVRLVDGKMQWEAPMATRKIVSENSTDAIQGDVAFPGHVSGIVRVARTPEEAEGARMGNVLVATMTTPAFGLELARVGGIVTDEGGLLCHAAVIAAAERIPCIVGTGRATHIFHTGDLAVLDAQGKPGVVSRGDWDKGVRRPSPVLWRYFSTLGHSTKFVAPALDVENGLDTCKNVDHQTFLASHEYSALRRALAAHIEQDFGYFDEMARRCYKQVDALLEVARGVNERACRAKVSKDRLLADFQAYHDATLRTIPFRYGILILDELLTQALREELRQQGVTEPQAQDLWLSATVSPSQPSYERQYADLVAQIARRVRDTLKGEMTADAIAGALADSGPVSEDANSVLTEFAWIKTSYFTGDPLTAASLAEDIAAQLEDVDVEADDEADFEADRANVSVDAAALEVAGKYLHLRSHRISSCYKADFLVRPLLEQIADLVGLAYGDLIQMTGIEIKDSIVAGSATATDTTIRGQSFDLYLANGDLWVDAGPNRAVSPLSEGRGAIELHGQTAFPGNAQGPARLVLGKRDLGKLQPGDVIVSPMTTNDLTAAIKERCVAIVTDEGGIGSHAAIIARENQIPCVVGTGEATAVLRDGDQLNVDATSGTVRVRRP